MVVSGVSQIPAGFISSCLCPRGSVPLGVGTGLGAAPARTVSKSSNCRIRLIEGDREELKADDVMCCVDNDLAGALVSRLAKCLSRVEVPPGLP